jgi:hypothetical protein
MFALTIALSMGLMCCDFEVTTNEFEVFGTKANLERVKTNIEEAKVVSSIAILNQQMMLTNQLALTRNIGFGMKRLVQKLERQQQQIKDEMNDLAEEKLILLPNKFSKSDLNTLKAQNDTAFLKVYFQEVQTALNHQIAQLDYLSTITNDLDFKLFTVKALERLNAGLRQINEIKQEN